MPERVDYYLDDDYRDAVEAELSIAEDQYDTDTENMSEFLAVHNRLKEELKECKSALEGWKTDCYSAEGKHNRAMKDMAIIRQQTAKECMKLAAARSPIVGYDIANAIKTKYGV